MKNFLYLIITTLLLTISSTINAEKKVTIEGKTITETTVKTPTESTAIKTEYTYIVKDQKYTIYLSKNGKAFINRVSKNGNEYRYYLPDEISARIAPEYGITPKLKES